MRKSPYLVSRKSSPCRRWLTRTGGLALLALATITTSTQAQDQFWDAPNNSAVDNGASWDTGNFLQSPATWFFEQPSTGSSRFVAWNDTGGGVPNTTSGNITVRISDYQFGPSGFAVVGVSHTAATLSINGNADLRVSMPLTINNELFVDDGGSLSIIPGGHVLTTGGFSGSSAAISVDGALLTAVGNSEIGIAGKTGELNLFSNATATLGTLDLSTSSFEGSSANLNVLGGSKLNLTGDLTAGNGTAANQLTGISVSGAGSQINQIDLPGGVDRKILVGSSAPSIAGSDATVGIANGGSVTTGRLGLEVRRTGTVNVNDGGTLDLKGPMILNAGTVILREGGDITYILAAANTTIRNGGFFEVEKRIRYSGDFQFTLESRGTLRGANGLTFENGGTVNVNGGNLDTSSLIVESDGVINLTSGNVETTSFESGAGTFNHTGGRLIVDGGTFDPGAGDYRTGIEQDPTAADVTLRNEAIANVSGVVQIRSGDTLSIESGATFQGDNVFQIWDAASRSFVVVDGIGSVLEGTNGIGVGFNALEGRLSVRDGGVARTGGNLNIGSEGQLSGDGTLEANTVTNRGLMDISGGIFQSTVTGTLNIDGNFVQTSQGGLDIDIDLDGSQIDLLSISGNANLNGTLEIFGPEVLPSGLELEILDIGGTRTGQFDGLSEGATVDNFGGTDLMITYAGGDGNDVVLYTSSTTLLGDVDLSGTVDFLDISPFIAVLSGGTFQAEADCDESGTIDFLDIAPFIAILSGS